MRHYCLHCFATLDGDRCDVCGKRDRAADRARFWNLRPATLQLQRRLNLALLLTAGLAAILLSWVWPGPLPASGRMNGVPFLLPVGLCLGGFLATSTFTRERSEVRPGMIWRLIGSILFLSSLFLSNAPGAAFGLMTLAATEVVTRQFRRWKTGLQRGPGIPSHREPG